MNTKITIPTKKDSIKIFQKFTLFSNVECHCVSVAAVAIYLAGKIKKERPDLNMDIIFAVALFHDLGKGLIIKELEPEKYGFKPFDKQQMEIWQLQKSFFEPLKNLYSELKTISPGFNKKVHETDLASIIIGSLFPDFVHYIHQIGGANNQIYFDACFEIKIAHYADWITHQSNLISFDKRLDFILNKYCTEQTKEEKELRKEKEFALENEIFKDLDITPRDLNLDEINKEKSELFNEEYDNFKIKKIDIID